MKTKSFIGLFVLLIIFGCSSKLSTGSAAKAIEQTFQLTDKDKVEILGIAEESKDIRLVKFKINDKQRAAKIRKYDQGWQLDEVQNELGLWIPITSNSKEDEDTLLRLDNKVISLWAQVENVYQRRADLVPNLVETVKGAAAFEKDTFTAVTEALAKVGQTKLDAGSLNDPAAFAKFQQAQDGLSSALSRLMVVVEKYPELKVTENFKTLQSQLEGTENRITVERQRFNEAAQEFNSVRMNSIPGKRLKDKPYFKTQVEMPQQKVKF
jgi:LemA protein